MNTIQKIRSITSGLLIAVILLAFSVIGVMASPPGNDNFANATVIENLPFSNTANTASATIETDDPWTCVGQYKSIWYAYTPTRDIKLSVSAHTDYRYSVTLSIFSYENGQLSQINCQDGEQVNTNIDLSAGTPYYFELKARYTGGHAPYPEPPSDLDGGNITINILEILPPLNDNFADATIIQGVPFTNIVDPSEATTEPDEPNPCYWNFQKTIWYSFTPQTDGTFIVTSNGGYYTVLAIYSGPDLYSLQNLACNAGWAGISIPIRLDGGTTYYFQTYISDWGGPLTLNITQVFPPSNDDFANAKVISEAPYSDSADAIYASTELGEPSTCGWNFHKTLWYAFTASTSTSYTAEANGGGYATVAVYQGTDFKNLVQLACSTDWTARTTIKMEAGKTYYFQTHINDEWYGSQVNFYIYPTPPPEAHFSYAPLDPLKNETIQFYNESYDPYWMGIQACTWDFGDGSTTTDFYPTHAYATDGDYTVQLTATTTDNRTASTSQVVQVRTHDVGVTRFVVPTSARAGQTKAITVYVKNLYYAETVQVDLYKSTVNGYELVSSITQDLPVRPPSKAQAFNFNYTFTKEDAALGKVVFKAVVTIVNARDVYPGDNEMFSIATKVTR